ncbi:MAG: bifunctional (p)ppGpp synthetase/guanosine-3',5'-bis(diphosphate) 3'-pyrophosphohydrolase [Candidatus Magnetomorum sp.]|nr:bifunctional (p)ppGpp synthetase/guanosine-3',5'-bis(diphosphate) 3'-pyrophosphohydrolase [Candidatus Magnetomorum sp.]
MKVPFQIDAYRKKLSEALNQKGTDQKLVLKALDFAYNAHEGQYRKSGEPYIIHPCAVVEILLFEMDLDAPNLLTAAFLHDVVEDLEDITIDQIENLFGKHVSEIVDGCTKLHRYRMRNQTLKDLTHSKMFLTASQHFEIFLVKLADRLHNLRTLGSLPLSKRQRIARETLDIYAPIAAILNITPLRYLLFNQALTYLFPKNSRKIRNILKAEQNLSEVQTIQKTLEQAFIKESMDVTVRLSPKSLESFFNPIKRTLSINNSENSIDFNIIINTDNDLDCYKALGIINREFRPIPRKLRDFIANAKSNGYQSIHVRHNLFGRNYLMMVRTQHMDNIANQGILVHFREHNKLSEAYIEYIQEQFRMIGEYKGAAAERRQIIQDSKSDEIYLFTPQGQPISLPSNSIVLDFAYKIHSDIGKNCIGAIVNGKRLCVDDVLSDGQVIKILTDHSNHVDRPAELEFICKTPKARSAVNRQKNNRLDAFSEKIGRDILCQHMKKSNLDLNILKTDETSLILDVLNIESIQKAYQRIGQDKLSPKELLYYFLDSLCKSGNAVHAEKEFLGTISVEYLDNHFYKFAQCCNPYPGDKNIIGLLSKRGISFHYKNCAEIERLKISKEKYLYIKWISCEWPVTVFYVEIKNASVFSVIQSMAAIKEDVQINKVEEVKRGNRHVVMVHFEVNGLDAAKQVFRALPKGQVTINQYSIK